MPSEKFLKIFVVCVYIYYLCIMYYDFFSLAVLVCKGWAMCHKGCGFLTATRSWSRQCVCCTAWRLMLWTLTRHAGGSTNWNSASRGQFGCAWTQPMQSAQRRPHTPFWRIYPKGWARFASRVFTHCSIFYDVKKLEIAYIF